MTSKTAQQLDQLDQLDQLGQMIAYEQGELDQDATVDLFQNLLDTGLIYSLQGHYGRTAQAMLAAGMIERDDRGRRMGPENG